MNKTPNIFWVILLCVISYVGLLISLYSSRESDTWNPQQGYAISKGGRASESTVSVGSNSNSVAVPMTSRHSSALFSSKGRVRKYPTAFPQTPSSFQGGPAGTFSSPVSHMSSSQTMKSFGGGGTGGGVSMSGGVISSANSALSSNALPSLNGMGVGLSLPTPVSHLQSYGSLLAVSSSQLQEIGALSPASASTTPLGMPGRKNASSIGGNVLDDWVQGLINDNGWLYSDGEIDYFDKQVLEDLYNTAIANGDLPVGVTWEQFLSWFGDQSDRYSFPIPGGIWYMSILALGYALIIYFKKRKLQKQL